jgi:predicted amidohydrolase YtcJ
MQPYHAIDDGRWAEKKIGHERAKSTYAFRSLLDAGAMLTFGSDWTVAPLNPLLGVYAAVTRRTIDGRNLGGWIPEQKIGVEEALRCYTANNAWAMFMEGSIGKIAPGMLADIAVLSDDIFTIAPEKIRDVKVDVTIFDGLVIYQSESSHQCLLPAYAGRRCRGAADEGLWHEPSPGAPRHPLPRTREWDARIIRPRSLPVH